ncbi:hypothetical protein IEQ34_023232 [Dendrobium chrysotoxum]|uniref:Uncharacterized protein n=1 Tax=Dendrobium chrysotoxum TaxID=161865 RepID=A0AAV7FVQ7_DENCH|nr:hypothetical protein IEQ34_023232 [Dendrobium chrysotoxum]
MLAGLEYLTASSKAKGQLRYYLVRLGRRKTRSITKVRTGWLSSRRHACDNFDCPIAKLVPRMRFYRHAMPTIKQLLRNARQPIRNVTKSPALRGCPQRRGTCTRDRKEKGSEIGDMLRRIVSQIFFISSHFISSQINTRIQSGLKQDEKKRNAKASLDGDSDPETEPASS